MSSYYQRVPIYGTLINSLNFAVRNFNTVARIGWLPLCLVILLGLVTPHLYLSIMYGKVFTIENFSTLKASAYMTRDIPIFWQSKPVSSLIYFTCNFFLIAMLYSSVMVPLLRLSAKGITPTHRSAQMGASMRHVKYVLAEFANSLGVIVSVFIPMMVPIFFIYFVFGDLTSEVAVFPDENSIHTIDWEPSAMTQAIDNYSWAYFLPFIAALIYFSVRLLPYPYMIGIYEKGDNQAVPAKPLKDAWRLTAGFNFFRFLAILLMLSISMVVVNIVLNFVAAPILQTLVAAIYGLTKSVNSMINNGEIALWVRPIFEFIYAFLMLIINLLYQFFIIGMVAGFGGSLYRSFIAMD